MHCAIKFLSKGFNVVGVDNLNNYYDPDLKKARLTKLKTNSKFNFIKSNIENNKVIQNIFSEFNPSSILHLAAQAGVRYSLTNPMAYIESNIKGFMVILEA